MQDNLKDIENIIIDGNSTDNTVDICKSFAHISKIIAEKDDGIYDAFNKGINQATGDVIGFLNSDDVFIDSRSLTHISKAFENNTDCVHGNIIYKNETGKIFRKWKSSSFFKNSFKNGWMPAHPTFYCKKSVYDKYGKYNKKYKIAGDFELMLRFYEKHKVNSKFINKTLVEMKSGGVSDSGIVSKIQILKEEFDAFKINNIRFNKLFYVLKKALKVREFF
tara:strand:- start:492 stop:1154 length:663 start_codon:yes stop_codon:yes gene_type:complete